MLMPLPHPVPDPVSLDLLQSVAELGSIRRAAMAHHVSQPAASMRLRALERTLGLELLDRSSGRARLTPAGIAVVEWGGAVLDEVRALLMGVAALRAEGTTQLRLAASMTAAEYLVPAWLNRLRAAEPDLRVSLQMGNSEHVADVVARREADLGFVEGDTVPAALESKVVSRDELVLVVAPSHPWGRRRKALSAPEVAATPLVLREPGSGTRQVFEGALGACGLSVTPLVELGSTTAIKAAVGSGLGPGVLSRLAIRAEVNEGRMVIVPTSGFSLERSIRAVWPRSVVLAPAASLLLAQINRPNVAPATRARPAGGSRSSDR